jgi:hypothetical protein
VDLVATLPTNAYTARDRNTADVYLTDLPPDALKPGADLSEVWGQLVHLHLFVAPKPGSTPIATSACSVTVRAVVIARGEIGVYGGGGFLDPETEPGDSVLEGSMRRASCRLVAKTPGFMDRLGASSFQADFTAARDEPGARSLAARLQEILALTTPVQSAPPEP